MREGYSRDQAVAIAYDMAMENIEKGGPERRAELRRERRLQIITTKDLFLRC
jgi:hypothetical protein